MPVFLDTRGRTKLAIAICGRCGQKFPYDDLREDPNFPGLYVCPDDLDQFDPYRLPARQTENITLEHPRPDIPLTDFRPTPLFGTNVLSPIVDGAVISTVTSLRPARPWQPRTFYRKGDTVTRQNVDDPDVTLPQTWLVCLEDGFSGDVQPEFPTETGVFFDEGTGHHPAQRITQDGATRITEDGKIRVING